ncbi:MAG: diacylglycerol kinase [Treponema sp.]|jgi:diacylglycerol kinase family enzyme|nr:diacylglycerol kinase [Treponema sp.]
MDLQVFAACMAGICSHSLVSPGRVLKWTIIANPSAGGFTIKSRWKKHEAILGEYLEKAQSNPLRKGSCPSRTVLESGGTLAQYGFIPTKEAGHGSTITKALIDEAGAYNPGNGADISGADKQGTSPFYLIITAGGDGTSLEVLTALYHAPPPVRSNFAVLRLPMGTGNDGADAAELDGALEFLIKPVKIELACALSLSVAASGKGPFLAFNILSVGLDAFVTHMTNKMKGKLPGDSYKLWVDIASLLYDRLYKVGPMEVRAFDEKKREVIAFHEKVLLLAVGASGHRTYGSRKKILPDDRNVCALKQMPLLRKVALKELFNTGGHIDKPEAIPFNAHRVEFSGYNPILAQMDGETVLLQPEDFPAAITLTDKVIPVLKKV